MGQDTKIQWADHTFNPWRGCTKVAAGCANCYAEALSKRNPGVLGVWGFDGARVVASEAMWREPVKWNRMSACVCRKEAADYEHEPGCPQRVRPRVFGASLCDVFEDWRGDLRRGDRRLHVPRSGGEWIDESPEWSFSGCRPLTLDDVRLRLFGLIDATPNLDWLLLTKRPENIRRMWPTPSWSLCRDGSGLVSHDIIGGKCRRCDGGRRDNVWLGTSVACQDDADSNVPELLKCRDLCAKVFLSVEPLIGPVLLENCWDHARNLLVATLSGESIRVEDDDAEIVENFPPIDWVVVGGESGPNARPCDVEWIRSVVRKCRAAGVPVFVKQLGARPFDSIPNGYSSTWPSLVASGSFSSFERWVNKAASHIGGRDVVCLDAAGRTCAIGRDFMRARDENTFPVRWHDVMRLRDPKGGDPAEWPEDLRVREVPYSRRS